MRKTFLVIVLAVAAMAASTMTALGQPTQTCQATGTSTEEAPPGVTLTWDSAFLCRAVASGGSYDIAVEVENGAASGEAVTITSVALSHTTPRPGGQGPDATAATTTGLPLTLGVGESGVVSVQGEYELVGIDEGAKANLHLVASGTGVESGTRFTLGINLQLRGKDSAPERDQAPPPAAGQVPPGLRVAQLAMGGAEAQEIAATARALDRRAAEPPRRETPGSGNRPPGSPPWVDGPPPWAGRP
jgi:hypothetical protein